MLALTLRQSCRTAARVVSTSPKLPLGCSPLLACQRVYLSVSVDDLRKAMDDLSDKVRLDF
jgi:hypothetical protein